MNKLILITLFFSLTLSYSATTLADIKPDELLIITNSQYPNSLELGKYYANKRNIPPSHIVSLNLPNTETMSWQAYENMSSDIKKFIIAKGLKDKIKVLVLISGVPLKITARDGKKPFEVLIIEKKIENLKNNLSQLKGKLSEEGKKDLENQLNKLVDKKPFLQDTRACVDSEISLLWWDDHPFYGWLPNPLYYRYKESAAQQTILMVARLDGPNPKVIKRMIDDAIFAEKKGDLNGKVYLDARGKAGKDAYSIYDESIRRCEKLFNDKTSFEVVVDNKPGLFAKNSASDALFYCGWYSVKKYVPAFSWEKGSVGYHIASFEAVSLRSGNAWCKRMIEEGITATFGPVGEPYLQTFPLPYEFFNLLLSGKYTLVETYYKSLQFLSWKHTLIGDPLYKPFKRRWFDWLHLRQIRSYE